MPIIHSETMLQLVRHTVQDSTIPSRSTSRRLLATDAETTRLKGPDEKAWRLFGPYLSDRQWGTVREDYSENGDAWNSVPFEIAHKKAYRWGEDGLMGICDDKARLCFALALWNGKDSILKERLYGLTGSQGNHGEDVKELYYHLDSTPTHSYMKALYKYPMAAYPYDQLKDENQRRGKLDSEFEITDTGVFDGGKYWDVFVEYAKETPTDVCIQVTVENLSPSEESIHVLPTVWFRNTWHFGIRGEKEDAPHPRIKIGESGNEYASAVASHHTLGDYEFIAGAVDVEGLPIAFPELWFTENETNYKNLYGQDNPAPYVKDGFNRKLVKGESNTTNPEGEGSKCAAYYQFSVPGHAKATIRLRLRKKGLPDALPAPASVTEAAHSRVVTERRQEADIFYDWHQPDNLGVDELLVQRQAYAGLLWTKQVYYYDVSSWLHGDLKGFPPGEGHKNGRNKDWPQLHCHDVISMPDKWEYPWFAAWDLAFHVIPLANIDSQFAKQQLLLFLSDQYLHSNGQIPAYEWNFSDVNPPVHAWAVWRVYKQSASVGKRDRGFLKRCFHKLMLNFSWWINRKDADDNNIFGGGFLGLDNIGLFDRSQPLPTGGTLDQSDGTSWMAFFASQMLDMSLELALEDEVYEDIAIKFFDHLVAIFDAMNCGSGGGLWDEEDGFYYDRIRFSDKQFVPLKIKSLVGLVPLFAVLVVEANLLEKLPDFKAKIDKTLETRPELAAQITFMTERSGKSAIYRGGDEGVPESGPRHYLLAIPSKERLVRILHRLLDENQFLSPYGIRSLSYEYKDRPYEFFDQSGNKHTLQYVPGESDSSMFGGNSNWRGPIWFPTTFLIMAALERFYYFYRNTLLVECPTGSGKIMNLRQVSQEIGRRLALMFLKDGQNVRPCHGKEKERYAGGLGEDLALFYEFFDPESGRGVGASHQTGWTGLIARCFDKIAQYDVEDFDGDNASCTSCTGTPRWIRGN